MSERATEDAGIALSVIVPVYDQEGVIVENVRAVCERVGAGLDGGLEVIVVSDGSIDGTAERVLAGDVPGVRVLHYDRNLGKGYAVRTGSLEARGRWIGYVDADLDLDPAALPGFVEVAEREELDFVIGSKRHPDSQVHYPRSRVFASWLFQQLVRLLFRLDVRDTQVGLKVFRREVAEEVMPLLLVKRYAFDIELLAVARAFGFGRVKEMPIVLDYRFTGSGVRSAAVFRAVVDTLATFYRLRILHYYQRRRASSGSFAWSRPSGFDGEVALIEEGWTDDGHAAAEEAGAEIVAFLEQGARPSANWPEAAAAFFARPDIDAVVIPQLAPAGGSARQRAAAAIAESRIGGGSLRFRFTPGAIRFVSDFPARSFVIRRERLLELPPGTPPEQVVLELTVAGHRTLYLPDASVTIPPAPVFSAHLRRIASYGRVRGALVRRRGVTAARLSTVGAIAFLAWVAFGWLLLLVGPAAIDAWVAVWCVYLAVVAVAAMLGGVRFVSARVGLLMAAGLPLTHLAYGIAFCTGFARPRRP